MTGTEELLKLIPNAASFFRVVLPPLVFVISS
jgi:hypothetical protein